MSVRNHPSSVADEMPSPAVRSSAPRLTFGIYPGSATGSDSPEMLVGRPDEPARIQAALRDLQGDGRPFIVRGYIPFHDSSSARPLTTPTPVDVEQYARDGRRLDVVLQFQSAGGDVEGYVEFVRRQVRRLGPVADSVQVTEEAELHRRTTLARWSFPDVREALVKGVLAAKDEARRLGFDHVKVGFNAVPSFGPNDDFWRDRRARATAVRGCPRLCRPRLLPRRVPTAAADGQPGDLRRMVVAVLRAIRESWMPAAGHPRIRADPRHRERLADQPRTAPTSGRRPCSRRSSARSMTIGATIASPDTIYSTCATPTAPTRTSSTSSDILRDDYTPKPAFEVYRRLIAELGES